MNLVLRKSLLPGCAAGVLSRFIYLRPSKKPYKGTRILFFAPWKEFTLVGTHHRPYYDEPENLRVTAKEVNTFLEEVQHVYPGGAIQKEDVSFWHKGFLPMDGVNGKSGEVFLTKHYRIYDHEKEDGVEGFMSVIGVKYTTARGVAEKTVNLVFKKLGRKRIPSKTHCTPIWGGEIKRFENFKACVIERKVYELSPKVLQYLVYHYGSEYPNILSYLEKNPKWAELLPGSEEVILSEIVHAVREEMAVKLSDVILRRTSLGAGGHPGEACLKACASMMADELGWSKATKEKEILETAKLYTLTQ
jgi:glycerol-3-phosphate dehydrogenase